MSADADARVPTEVGRTAVLLSLLSPGLGHLYLGRERLSWKILACIGVGWVLVTTGAVWLGRDLLTSIGFSVAIAIATQIGLAVDVYRRARPYARGSATRPRVGPRSYLLYLALWCAFGFAPYELRRAYVVESFRTPSSSFEPTLRVDDHFVVTKLRERDRHPRRGDIVVFEYPQDPREKFVKRVIGLPGETVQFGRDGTVLIDGVALAREQVAAPPGINDPANVVYFREHAGSDTSYLVKYISLDGDEGSEADARGMAFSVPPGHLFVIGDNRDQSHDSRAFGPVAIERLEGRACAIWLPFARAGALQ